MQSSNMDKIKPTVPKDPKDIFIFAGQELWWSSAE